MDKQNKYLKQINEKSKLGKFAEVIQLIKEVQLNKESALHVQIYASNACYNSLKQNYLIEEKELPNLLKILRSHIDNLNESSLVLYLQSLFHIIKLLADKEYFQELSEMEAIITPDFLNDLVKRVDKAKRIYQEIVSKLYNLVYYLVEAKNCKYNPNLIELAKITLIANNKINDTSETLGLARKFLSIFIHLNLKTEELGNFYLVTLDLMRTQKLSHKILPLIANMFSTIFSKYIEKKSFDETKTFLSISQLYLNQEEYKIIFIVFEIIAVLFPNNQHLIDMEKCRTQMENFKLTNPKSFFEIIRFLDEPLYFVLSYYRLSGSKEWSELPVKAILNFVNILKIDICSNIVNTETKCSCRCKPEKNYLGVLKIGYPMSELLKNYLKSKENLHTRFLCEIKNWFAYIFNILKKFHKHNCKEFDQIWTSLGIHTYNTGTVLYSQENIACIDFFACFVKHWLEFNGSTSKLMNSSFCEMSLNAICEIHFKNENYEGSMSFAALYYLFYSKTNVFTNWWVKAKLKLKDNSEIQQQTLVKCLEKHSDRLKCITNPKQHLTKEKTVELLILELSCYKSVWKSKEPIMAAFRHLSQIAELPEIARVVVDIFGDGDIQVHVDMQLIFSEIMKKFKDALKRSKNSQVELALAVLYYINYKNSWKEATSKNLEDMERTMQVLESAKQKFEPVPKDPNEECDIVSAYANLRLDKFTEILLFLNRSLDIFTGVTKTFIDSQFLKSSYKLLVKIGFEYRLQCVYLRSIQAFQLSLNLAQLMCDNENQLVSLSFLIERADVNKNYVKEMIATADSIATLMEMENGTAEYNKTLVIYYTSKAKAFLYEDKKIAFESWQLAEKWCNQSEENDEFQFLKAELYIISFKLSKACDFQAGEHERSPMTTKLHYALDIVINLSQTSRLMPYHLCILFDTVYELTQVYYLMRLPRDLRAYSKNSVLLTQKIILPLRCVSFLLLLAHSDLLTCKFDHCHVKLSGINDIFCLEQSCQHFVDEKDYSANFDIQKVDEEVDRVANQIQELVLDLPQHNTREYSPSSPRLVVASYKAPQFLLHPNKCLCFLCTSFEYHQQLLQKCHLEALVNMYEKEDKLADEFLQGAVMLYSQLSKNYKTYKIKAKHFVTEDLVPRFDYYFIECYGNILYDLSYHLIRKSETLEAMKANTELIQLLRPKNIQFVYLYNEALLQRLSYITPVVKENYSLQVDKDEDEEVDIKANKNRLIVTSTPKAKKSTVIVTINGCQKYSPPKRRVRKKVTLFNSPSDSEDNINKPPIEGQSFTTPKTKSSKKGENDLEFAVPKTKGRKLAVPLTSTPFFADHQTPKIKIFTDDPASSTRKSRKKLPASARKEVYVSDEVKSGELSLPKSEKLLTGVTTLEELNTAAIFDDSNEKSVSNEEPSSAQPTKPLVALARSSSSSTMSKLLTKKIKEAAIKSKGIEDQQTASRIRKNLNSEWAGARLSNKVVSTNREDVPPKATVSSDSSVVSGSPEQESAVSSKSKIRAEKLKKLSSKKVRETRGTVDSKNVPEVKKNLLSEFLDTADIKHTGAIRKSTRNRVL